MRRDRLGRNIDVMLEERRERRHARWLRVAGIVLGAAAAAYLTTLWFQQRGRSGFEEKRLVVAPFDNRTGDPAFDTLGLVIADWVTNGLARSGSTPGLVPTATAIAYFNSARLGRYDPVTRARLLARGTRSQIVVHGSYYRVADTLRFRVHFDDAVADTAWRPLREVVTAVDAPEHGVEQVEHIVVDRVLRLLWYGRASPARMPPESTYNAFVRGLNAYVRRDYAAAVPHFTRALSAPLLDSPAYLLESLVASRQYARAASLAVNFNDRTMPMDGIIRFARAYARLRGEPDKVYGWSQHFARIQPSDDVAQYDYALAALAVNHPREAVRIFGRLYPNRGALHGRPEYYLHYAAAYHLTGNHRAELRVVRDGQRARERALDARLAYCRVRAAMGDSTAALSALNALTYADIDTARASIGVATALEDCAAELDAHGLPAVARHAYHLARAWRRGEPGPAFVTDSTYETGRVVYLRAAREAEAGQLDQANASLREALEAGLLFYEPGRVMLHADPKLRRLHDTRAFLQLNQPQG